MADGTEGILDSPVGKPTGMTPGRRELSRSSLAYNRLRYPRSKRPVGRVPEQRRGGTGAAASAARGRGPHIQKKPVHLIQLLVPAGRETAKVVPVMLDELTERFCGSTAYVNSSAKGEWSEGGEVEEDRVVVVDVMDEEIDHAWWQHYRVTLTELLRQKDQLVRALPAERL